MLARACCPGEPPTPRSVPARRGRIAYREAPEASRRCRQPPRKVRVARPGRRGSGSTPEASAAEVRSQHPVLRRAGMPNPGSPGERPTEAADGEDGDGCGFGRGNRELGGGPSTGVSAPEGTSAPSGASDPAEGVAMGASSRSVRPRGPQSTGPGRSEQRSVRRPETDDKPRRMAGAEQKPHEWQRSQRPQRGRGASRRESGKLCGRNVPGEASPGLADPVTDVAEGAPNPRRGTVGFGPRSAVRLVP
jgi:hypothetical protein